MKSKAQLLKQTLLVFALMVAAITVFSMLPSASAASGLLGPDDNPLGGGDVADGNLRSLVLTIINYFLGFLGLLAVIMVIYGGVTYVISAGNDEQVQNAKKIIMYALVGIIVILLAFVLVQAVIGAGTGVEA